MHQALEAMPALVDKDNAGSSTVAAAPPTEATLLTIPRASPYVLGFDYAASSLTVEQILDGQSWASLWSLDLYRALPQLNAASDGAGMDLGNALNSSWAIYQGTKSRPVPGDPMWL